MSGPGWDLPTVLASSRLTKLDCYEDRQRLLAVVNFLQERVEALEAQVVRLARSSAAQAVRLAASSDPIVRTDRAVGTRVEEVADPAAKLCSECRAFFVVRKHLKPSSRCGACG